MTTRTVTLAVALATLIHGNAAAAACDFAPGRVLGPTGSGAATATVGVTSAAGAALQAAGFYTLTNAATGATMLASTAGGASAAGTVGILGGTAGAIGTAAAVLLSPALIVGGAALVGTSLAYEGVSWLRKGR
jgi:hypothetical protein